jgi:hypothetical protein
MMSPARRWYVRSIAKSGVADMTTTGRMIPMAAQTCESRIVATPKDGRQAAPTSAGAVTDFGRPTATQSANDRGD